ncbi:heme-binding protein 1-like isoform X2 [Stegodyphus dumicola]|uniref:heme-binding protein 1-like isoform X2 n=1 Tax=Stegodyphus dumicola TaxID=202533 RepID=UPI0015A9072F|nr:heme-binding protein 1-like isoform X2 [Stegodyphus dumicola]
MFLKMWKIALLIAVIGSAAEGCLYKNLECPDYVVVEQHPDYEVRSYPALTWATVEEESMFSRIAQMKAFRRLFKYISGKNDKGITINMTVPVRMQVTDHESYTAVEMSFMVPSIHANNPPAPNDTGITVEKEEPTLYAVRSFPGYVWRRGTWKEEAQKLADSLKNDDTVIKTKYYQVGYDAPFDFFDRRNEIWMVKRAGEREKEI